MKIRAKVVAFDWCSVDVQYEVRERALAGVSNKYKTKLAWKKN